MIKEVVTIALLAAIAVAPAFASTLPPDPIRGAVLSDGNPLVVARDGEAYEVVKGKQVLLPPGPCRLKNGTTIAIGADHKIAVPAASQYRPGNN